MQTGGMSWTEHPEPLFRLGLWTGVTGASTGLFAWQLVHWKQILQLVAVNGVTPEAQWVVLSWMAVGVGVVALAVVATLVARHRRGARADDPFHSVQRVLQACSPVRIERCAR